MKKPEDIYGYKECLEYAGATVNAFEEFGSYQGDWYANVTWEGKTFWIHDYYGSCSGCDAFESEFSYRKEKTDETIRKFALEYLENPLTQEQAEAEAAKYSAWDSSAEEVIKFVKENPVNA